VRAIEIGDYDDLLRKHPGSKVLNSREFPYAYVNNTNDTGPSLIIKPRKALSIPSGSL
jgi:anaerobic dimethyl sulfoxide reductase subunit B (iron-sulfur subunit)